MPSPIVTATIQATSLSALGNTLAQLISSWRTSTPFSPNLPDFLRFITVAILTSPPNFLWQEWLERTWPGRKQITNHVEEEIALTSEFDEESSIGANASVIAGSGPERLNWKNTWIKWFVDCMTMGALMNTVAFLVLMGLLKGKSGMEIINTVEKDTFPIIFASYKIWPIASILNFSLIPVEKRIVFLSFFGVLWSIFLSLFAAKI